MRYNADGSLDASFGTGGIANLSGVTNQWIEDMAQCLDGKILLALGINGTVYFRAARLNSNGALDSSFGSGGIQTYSGMGVTAAAIALMADGRFLLAGNWTSSSEVIRANADGTLDTTFGTSGVQTVSFGTSYTSIFDVAVDGAGRIALGCLAYGANNTADFAAARLNPNGSFDTSFDADGKVVTNFAAGLDNFASSMVVQSDDKIVLAGYTETSDNVNQVALVRYGVNGALDTSFDGDGRLQVSVTSSGAQRATSSAIQADGKLVVLAGWGNDWRVARFQMGDTQLSASDTLDVTDNDALTYDYGDAPAPYPTLKADNGARHVATGPMLGSTRDTEPDGQPTSAANGDNLTGTPDNEDGVSFGPWIAGQTAMVSVRTSVANAKLDAWIDFNGDGVWDDSAGSVERIFSSANLPLANMGNLLTFSVPAIGAGSVAGITYARFRLSTAGGLAPTGTAPDGEVEDYRGLVRDPSVPATIYVAKTWANPAMGEDPDGPGPARAYWFDSGNSIQDGVYMAVDGAGDTVSIAPGTYVENVTVDKGGLTLRGTTGVATDVVLDGIYSTTASPSRRTMLRSGISE